MRIKVSNLADVGQMRRRSGISMKIITNAHTLFDKLVTKQQANLMVGNDVQTNDAERNDKGGMEDVRDAEREAQKNA